MKRRVATAGLALAGLLGSIPAWALKITMDPVGPGPVGTPQTFRVAAVDEAIGDVTFRWNFGDGTVTDLASDLVATHTYQAAGHYTVIVLAMDAAARTSTTLVHTAHYPLTAQPPTHSSSIVFDAERHQVWNVNPDNDTVSVIDASALARVREVPVGKEPHSLALGPEGTLWVANQMSDEVVVLDRSTGDVRVRIGLAYASQPHSIAFGPSGMAYVSLFATGKLVEIDPASRAVRREVALGPTPAGVSVAADGRIFVTRFISPVDHGEVWVVSPDAFKLVNTIELPFDQTSDSQSSGRGVPNYVSSIVISPDGTQGWVTAKKDNVARGPQRDGQPMTSDNFVRSAVCAIDLKTETEIIEKRQDLDNRATPASLAFSPVGDYAYVLVQPDNWIGITDAYTGLNLSGMKQVGSAPDGLLLLPDGKLLVNAFLSREVIAYDLTASIASIDHAAPPQLARIRTVDREALSADVLLGKQVFFNADDKRMGHAGYMSCVSCHFGGFSDGRVWDFTDRGEGLRNTKSLLGARGMAEGRVHWSANFDEIQDFERDIRDSFEGTGFMPDPEFEARKTASGAYDTFGKSSAGVSKELDGLAAYITSFDRAPRSPFRNPDGSFTKDARAGRKIFEHAGCPDCHSGPDLTDSGRGMLHDVGTILPTSGMRLGGKLAGIDTPTLKGVWQTAPYLHDGRAATLTEIFTKYTKDEMGTTSKLTEAELGQLVRYLQELDDVPETPAADDVGEPAATVTSCSIEPWLHAARRPSLLGWLAACAAFVRRVRRPGTRTITPDRTPVGRAPGARSPTTA
jgi:YVTN family beta-propeller protein